MQNNYTVCSLPNNYLVWLWKQGFRYPRLPWTCFVVEKDHELDSTPTFPEHYHVLIGSLLVLGIWLEPACARRCSTRATPSSWTALTYYSVTPSLVWLWLDCVPNNQHLSHSIGTSETAKAGLGEYQCAYIKPLKHSSAMGRLTWLPCHLWTWRLKAGVSHFGGLHPCTEIPKAWMCSYFC